jgi:SAM-dependent methyltransferase
MKGNHLNNSVMIMSQVCFSSAKLLMQSPLTLQRKAMKTLRIIAFFSAALLSAAGCTPPVYTEGEVPFVGTPIEVVDRMLDMARVKKDDVLYDLGSGDGRIVIRAAKKFGTHGVGIEIDRDLVSRSRSMAEKEGVSDLVEFRQQDALTADVSEATVVTLYLLPEFNAKLRPIFKKQLKPGARVVSHDFGIEGWKPDREEKIPDGILHQHTIYLWEIR